jgi:hypothetical protein
MELLPTDDEGIAHIAAHGRDLASRVIEIR